MKSVTIGTGTAVIITKGMKNNVIAIVQYSTGVIQTLGWYAWMGVLALLYLLKTYKSTMFVDDDGPGGVDKT
ncbi:MAG: hypothetical protein WAM14_20775 [Candidatus Nitrosopolaris sp.]